MFTQRGEEEESKGLRRGARRRGENLTEEGRGGVKTSQRREERRGGLCNRVKDEGRGLR